MRPAQPFVSIIQPLPNPAAPLASSPSAAACFATVLESA
jgi:hypothetical protein